MIERTIAKNDVLGSHSDAGDITKNGEMTGAR